MYLPNIYISPAQMLYQAVASREASGVAFFTDSNIPYMAVAQVTLKLKP